MTTRLRHWIYRFRAIGCRVKSPFEWPLSQIKPITAIVKPNGAHRRSRLRDSDTLDSNDRQSSRRRSGR